MKIQANLIRKILLILLVVLVKIVPAYSQNISSSNLLWWTADQVTDLTKNNPINFQCEFKTNETQSVKWIQKKGEKTSTYTVTGTEGSWENIALDGSFTYLLTRGGNTARMIIEKSQGETFIIFYFSKPNEQPAKLGFHIQSVQTR